MLAVVLLENEYNRKHSRKFAYFLNFIHCVFYILNAYGRNRYSNIFLKRCGIQTPVIQDFPEKGAPFANVEVPAYYFGNFFQKMYQNKKVLLREHKRHTDHGISSTPLGYPPPSRGTSLPGQVRQGGHSRWGYPLAGVPLLPRSDRGGPKVGYSGGTPHPGPMGVPQVGSPCPGPMGGTQVDPSMDTVQVKIKFSWYVPNT